MKRANKLNYQWTPSLDSDGKNAKLLLKKGTNWEKKLLKQYLTSVGPVMCLPSSLVALGRASGQELQFTCSIRSSSADATHRRALSSKADKQMRNRLKSVGKHGVMRKWHPAHFMWNLICEFLCAIYWQLITPLPASPWKREMRDATNLVFSLKNTHWLNGFNWEDYKYFFRIVPSWDSDTWNRDLTIFPDLFIAWDTICCFILKIVHCCRERRRMQSLISPFPI